MPYCKALYNHWFVDVAGYYAPCCFYAEKKKYNHMNMLWSDFFNSEYMNGIRKRMETGWDDGCLHCKTLEDQSLPSYRNVVELYCTSNKPQIEYIEISCNNSCNIRCRMCGPEASSKWAETLDVTIENVHIEKLLSQIDVSNVKVIKYLGGEPFITPEIKILFSWMQNLPNPVKFYCNTNLMLFPKKYLDIFESFEQIIVGYSIDGIGSVNDYIRQDSKWDIVYKNLELWENLKKNINLFSYIHTTVQAYNFHNLSSLKKLCDSYDLHHSAFKTFGPIEFTLDALPPKYIENYTDEYSAEFIKTYEYKPNLHKKLIEKTQSQDRLFNTNINSAIPEFKYVLEDTYNDR